MCRRYGLTKLKEELRTWKGVSQELVKELELSELVKELVKELIKELTKELVKESELSEFIEITGFPSPVIIRRLDFRINVSHIAKLTGRLRNTVRDLRKWLGSKKYKILRGSKKY